VTFEEVVTQAMGMLRCQGRVSYRALKRQFNPDDSHLADLTAEIIDVHHVTIDQDGTMLVWTGGSGTTPPHTGPQPANRTAALGSVAKFDFWGKIQKSVSEIQRLTDCQTLEKATLGQNQISRGVDTYLWFVEAHLGSSARQETSACP
jgi:hypothetical protein